MTDEERGKLVKEATDAVRYVFKFAGVTLDVTSLYRVNDLLMEIITEKMEQTNEPK